MSGRTLLGIWAHPDDEAYLSAGLMASFRRAHDRVVVITATLGEHGTSDPDAWPPQRLAALRRLELRGSLAAVGVSELRLLGLPDGGCADHDATDLIGRHISEIRPDVIVTFGPDGMTGHPDHRAVSRWTTDAWRSLDTHASLWYATLDEQFHRRWGSLNEEIGLWGDQPHPPCTPDHELAHRLVLTDGLLDKKMAALGSHASQTRPLIDAVGRATYREWWRTESFRAASRSGEAGGDDEVVPVDRRRAGLVVADLDACHR
jgi:LmbE family N-acetylglucosaminyl deacetylase